MDSRTRIYYLCRLNKQFCLKFLKGYLHHLTSEEYWMSQPIFVWIPWAKWHCYSHISRLITLWTLFIRIMVISFDMFSSWLFKRVHIHLQLFYFCSVMNIDDLQYFTANIYHFDSLSNLQIILACQHLY